MKIKCIKHSKYDNYLTIGKIYNTNYAIVGNIYFNIINDIGAAGWYPNECFVAVDEWRNESLNKILP